MNNEMRETMDNLPFTMGRKRKIAQLTGQTSISEPPVKLSRIHPKEDLKVTALSIRNKKQGSLKISSQGKAKQNKTSSNSVKKVGSRKSQTKRKNTKKETKENTKRRNTKKETKENTKRRNTKKETKGSTKKRKASRSLSNKTKRKVKGKKVSKKAAANLLRKKTSPRFTLSFLNLKQDDQGRIVDINTQTNSENETEIPSPEQNLQTNYNTENETNIMDTESSIDNSDKDMDVNMEICNGNDLEQPYQELPNVSHFQTPRIDGNERLASTANQDAETDTIPREENLPINIWGSGEVINIMDTESSNENSESHCRDSNINLEISNEKQLKQYYQEPQPFELNLPSTSMEHANKVLNTRVKNGNEISDQNVKHVSESINGTINNENLRSEEIFLNDFQEGVTGLESIRNLSTYPDNMTRVMDTDRPFNEIKENTIQVFESSNETICNGNSRYQATSRSESLQSLSIYTQNTNGEVHTKTDKFLNEIPAHEATDGTVTVEDNTKPEVLKCLDSISLTDQENLRRIPLFSDIIPSTDEEHTRSIFTVKVPENSESITNFTGSANILNPPENRIVQTNNEANMETNNEMSERYIQTAFSMLPLALPGLLRYVYYALSK